MSESKNVVVIDSKLQLKELYDVKISNGEVFVELIQVLDRKEEENDTMDVINDASVFLNFAYPLASLVLPIVSFSHPVQRYGNLC